ncbi:MAG: phosphate/phosphite/phosphonate ABC transporter substrate-binding protein [Gammaproteobacteria bacterium]|nr:phosphate/phosphite/phosphonate ABC transporter substrate-binding protein [Gammaproteobacteria bacterium]MDH5778572.1 phosphate/phosphite/phosphonate ABC transporter substrate-binding protein [Gammaproteobacteria bacterium]
MNKKNILLTWFKYLCLIAVAIFIFNKGAYAEKTYVLARAPQLSPTILAKTWGPFVKRLSEITGRKIELKVYLHRSDFEKDIMGGKVDLFYANPGYLIAANRKHAYVPLIRSSQKKLKGIVVVRQDSVYKNIQDIKGQTIVFPSPKAFAASLLVRSNLKNLGVKFKSEYVKSHDDVYRSVVYRRFAAGGGVYRTFNRESANLKKNLRVLYETPGIQPHPLAAHPRVPKSVRQAIQSAVLAMADSAEDNKHLNKIKLRKPVKADFKRDYLPIQKMALEMYSYLL